MTTFAIIQTVGTILLSLGAVAFGIGQYRKGRGLKTIEDLQLFNAQLATLKAICDEQQKEINRLKEDGRNMRDEISKLKGINESLEFKIKELLDALANRDPALLNYIKDGTEYIKYSRENVEAFKAEFAEIRDLLKSLLTLLQTAHTHK